MEYGIDTSYAQGAVNWAKVQAASSIKTPSGVIAQKVSFAIIKATGEETAGDRPFRDSQFARSWKMCGEIGLRRGAYHFLDGGAGSAPGKVEAEFFLKIIEEAGGFKDGDILPVVDVEWPPRGGEYFEVEQLADYLETIENSINTQVTLYTGRWYWDKIKDKDLLFWCARGRPLWVAAYTQAVPKAPAPWTNWDIWQFTDKGRVDGIDGNVDVNRAININMVSQ